MKQKTISGARAKIGQKSNGCNPKHNNRDYLPSNADPTRQHLNEYYVDGTKGVTLEQIYDKIFQKSYEEWLDKEHQKGRQLKAPGKYIDKIRQSKDKKRDQYEIIWQIGDMKNTGWDSAREDFEKARILLDEFAKHLMKLPEVEFITPKKIADPNWQPSFDNGIIITNMALHGDENTPQIHMDFVPYSRTKTRGQRIQNAYAAAFEGMGYPVEDVILCDEQTGEVIYKQDKEGNIICDKNGEPVPVKQKVRFGSVDWIEFQKSWLQQKMLEEHDWDREFKGKNEFGNVTISRYVVEDNARIIAEQEKTIEGLKEENHNLENTKKEYERNIADVMQEYRTEAAEMRSTITDMREEMDVLIDIQSYEQTAQNAYKRIEEQEEHFEVILQTCAELPSEESRNRLFDSFLSNLKKLFEPQINAIISKLEDFERHFKELFQNRLKESEQLHPTLDALIGNAEKLRSEQGKREYREKDAPDDHDAL